MPGPIHQMDIQEYEIGASCLHFLASLVFTHRQTGHLMAGHLHFAFKLYGEEHLVFDWSFVLGVMASPKATIDCTDAFGRTDFGPDLKAFTIPTLVMHGTYDKTVPTHPTRRGVPRRPE